MNVENFKEEFSKFLARFAVPNDNNDRSIVAPLTSHEILEAVQDVLGLKFDATLVNSSRDDVRTPASGIVMTTPDAPDIPKLNVESIGSFPGRFRSLDTLTVESLKDLSVDQLVLPEPGKLTAKDEDNNDLFTIDVTDARTEEKKLISKSSPSVSILVRSNTFVCDEELQSVTNKNLVDDKKIDSATNNENDNKFLMHNLSDIMTTMTVFKDLAIDIVKKIDVIQNVAPENTRPIRRLSTMAGFPGLNRTSSTSRTIQRPKMLRRSMGAFPGTPTSSRLSPEPDSRRKSTSTLSMSNTGGSKLSIPSTHRSISSGALVVKKKSPAPSAGSTGACLTVFKAQKTPVIASSTLSSWKSSSTPDARQAKNPKYAHVQSTIPKSGSAIGKKKAT